MRSKTKWIERKGDSWVLVADVDTLLNGELGKKFQKQMMELSNSHVEERRMEKTDE